MTLHTLKISDLGSSHYYVEVSKEGDKFKVLAVEAPGVTNYQKTYGKSRNLGKTPCGTHMKMEECDMEKGKEVAIQGESFFNVIERLASNPDVDVDKIKQFVEMQEHILDRNAEQAFNAAMGRAQKNMPIVPKDKTNKQTSSKYSGYETILKFCKPIYTAEGFSLMFYEGETTKENEIRVMVDVMHEDGCTKVRFVDVPFDNVGIKGNVNKTMTHGKGSSVQYGRGYLCKMIFNIPTGDDDDGNGAGIDYISEAQHNELDALLRESGLLDDDKYMKQLWNYLKVESLDKLPATGFMKAKNGISHAITQRAKK